MGGRPPPTPEERDAAHEQLNSLPGLDDAWRAWSEHEVVVCVADGSPVALCVDAPISTYRFICVACGNSSPWFEVSNGEVHSRPSTVTEGVRRPSSPY